MPPAPQSLADLLAEESGDDLDKMEVDRPSAVAPPKKAASPPATPPRPPPLKMPDGNEAVNAAIAGASSGTPKRKKVEHDPFIDTLGGKEFVQKFLNAGKPMKVSPRAGFKESDKCDGLSATYRFLSFGLGEPGGAGVVDHFDVSIY